MIYNSENIEITNITSLADKIQVGNIIQIVDDTNPDKRIIHNMVVVPMANGKLAAIEELMSDDKITTGDFTYCNYTELDFKKYPNTLGIEPKFGTKVAEIYRGLGFHPSNLLYTITYYNEKEGYWYSLF